MANIQVCDLSPIGTDLFIDSEGFMTDLSEDELGIQGGGMTLVIIYAITTIPSRLLFEPHEI